MNVRVQVIVECEYVIVANNTIFWDFDFLWGELTLSYERLGFVYFLASW